MSDRSSGRCARRGQVRALAALFTCSLCSLKTGGGCSVGLFSGLFLGLLFRFESCALILGEVLDLVAVEIGKGLVAVEICLDRADTQRDGRSVRDVRRLGRNRDSHGNP